MWETCHPIPTTTTPAQPSPSPRLVLFSCGLTMARWCSCPQIVNNAPVEMRGDKLVATLDAANGVDYEPSNNKSIRIIIASTDSHNHTVQRVFDICVNGE